MLATDVEPAVAEELPDVITTFEEPGPAELMESAPHAGENIPTPAAATIAVTSMMGEVRLSLMLGFSGGAATTSVEE